MARKPKEKKALSSLVELYYCLPRDIVKANQKTRKDNVSALARVLRCAYPNCEPYTTDHLRDLFKLYKIKHTQEKMSSPDYNERKCCYSMNSTMRQIASMFGKLPLESYREKGYIFHDDIGEVSHPRYFKGVDPENETMEVFDIFNRVILPTLPNLKETQPDVYLAFIIMINTGMRNSEVVDLTMSNIGMKGFFGEDTYCVEVLGTKTGKPRHIPISAEVFSTIAEMSLADETDYILGDSKTYRNNIIYKKLSKWIRNFIPRSVSEKSSYLIRKIWESRVARDNGIHVAAKLAGHSVETAAKHYVGLAAKPVITTIT
jgi:integrase